MGVIYGLHAGDGVVRYVGLTTKTIAARFNEHVTAAASGSNLPVHRWLRKHIDAQPVLIDTADSIDLLNDLEQFWIAVLHTFADERLGGLNATTGGGSRGRLSAETKQKIADKLKGVSHLTDDGRARISAKVSAARRGTTISPEQRDRISQTLHGNTNATGTRSPEQAEAMRRNWRLASHRRWHVNRNISKPECEFCES